MPIYEYQCESCGHELEKIQRMSDSPLSDCPDCGKPELRRLVSAAAFRLKGAGWYETDFKKDGKKNLHDSHTSSTSPGKSPDASSSKPASTDAGASGKTADTTKTTSKPAASKTDSA